MTVTVETEAIAVTVETVVIVIVVNACRVSPAARMNPTTGGEVSLVKI